MKQLLIIMGMDKVVIDCEYITLHDGQVYAMNNKNEIIGIFMVGTFSAMWVSDKGE